MSILNVKKMKTDGDFLEISFYREQPAPVPNQPQTPHPMAPRQHLDKFKAEMQAMMEDMSAGLIGKVREQMTYKVGQTGRRLEGDLRDLDERVGVFETPAGQKRRISYELIRPEEIKRERN